MRPIVLFLVAACASASAQTIHSPVVPDTAAAAPRAPRLSVRVAGGMGSLSLGQAGAFHEAVADGYRAAGVPVPTQRSFGPGLQGGVDVLWETAAGRQFGLGVRTVGTAATSLYGDYGGTLDIVSAVRAVFAETVSVVELRPSGAVRPFLGTRGGTVFASAETREVLDLGTAGAARSRTGGRGLGYSLEGFGGVAAQRGALGVFAQAGYRYARVGRLTGSSEVDGQSVEEGQLPYALELSGWTCVLGLALRR